MSQQEDDLRALAKIMDFLRAVSIILVVMNVYWFCYEAIRLWGVDIGVVDRILMNFDRTAGLFRSILYTKLFAVLLLALSCLGTKGVKGEKITWGKIWAVLAVGFVLFFLNWWILALPLPVEAVTGLYILAEPFTEQNGLINSTMKIVRNKVEEYFRDRIDYLYTPEGRELRNDKNLASLRKMVE